MSTIPNFRESRYLNNAIAIREALKDYVNSETVSIGNGIMFGGHKKTRKFKKRYLCELLHNFETISLVTKTKKCLKMRASFRASSFQHVISPTTIFLSKVNFKRTRTM